MSPGEMSYYSKCQNGKYGWTDGLSWSKEHQWCTNTCPLAKLFIAANVKTGNTDVQTKWIKGTAVPYKHMFLLKIFITADVKTGMTDWRTKWIKGTSVMHKHMSPGEIVHCSKCQNGNYEQNYGQSGLEEQLCCTNIWPWRNCSLQRMSKEELQTDRQSWSKEHQLCTNTCPLAKLLITADVKTETTNRITDKVD